MSKAEIGGAQSILPGMASGVLAALDSAGFSATLFGGLAVSELRLWEIAFDETRVTPDIDIILDIPDVRKSAIVFKELGAVPEAGTWLASGGRLGRYLMREKKIDIFSNPLFLNQRIPVPRYAFSGRHAPLFILLLSKLQLANPTWTDVRDALSILVQLGHIDDAHYARDISRLCSRDWCLEQAITLMLGSMAELGEKELSAPHADSAQRAITLIRKSLDSMPKSLGWQVRATFGRLMPMYAQTST